MMWDFILRLFVAGILGAVVGLDREFLVPAHHPYGRGESDGRENLPRVIRGEHVFTQRLGYGIPRSEEHTSELQSR